MTTRVSVDAPNHEAFVFRFQPGVRLNSPDRVPEGGKLDMYVHGDSYVIVTEQQPDGRRGGKFIVERTGLFFKEWRWTYYYANGNPGFRSTEGYKNFADAMASIPTPIKLANSDVEIVN